MPVRLVIDKIETRALKTTGGRVQPASCVGLANPREIDGRDGFGLYVVLDHHPAEFPHATTPFTVMLLSQREKALRFLRASLAAAEECWPGITTAAVAP